MQNNELILSVRDLDISFQTNAGDVHAIRGVDMDLHKGETVAIVGESGSGKSVSMKAVMGILDKNGVINKGKILFTYQENGKEKTVDIVKLDRRTIRHTINGRRIAMVFQDPMTSLDPTMSVGKQIIEGMILHEHMHKHEAWKKAVSLLEIGRYSGTGKAYEKLPAPAFRWYAAACGNRYCAGVRPGRADLR